MDRETDRQMDRETDRHSEKKIDRRTEEGKNIQKQTKKDKIIETLYSHSSVHIIFLFFLDCNISLTFIIPVVQLPHKSITSKPDRCTLDLLSVQSVQYGT